MSDRAIHCLSRHVFLLGTATPLAAGIVLTRMHKVLCAADRGKIAQPVEDELDQIENENPFPVAEGIGNAN